MQAERANAIGNSLKEEKNLFIDTRHYYYLITLSYHQSHCMRSLCSCMTKWKRKITKVYFNSMQTFTVEFQMISDRNATILVVLVLVTLSHLPSTFASVCFSFSSEHFCSGIRNSTMEIHRFKSIISMNFQLYANWEEKTGKKPTKTFVYCFDIQ